MNLEIRKIKVSENDQKVRVNSLNSNTSNKVGEFNLKLLLTKGYDIFYFIWLTQVHSISHKDFSVSLKIGQINLSKSGLEKKLQQN